MTLRFADCVLDVGRRELLRSGEPIRLEPQVFALLQLLIENRHRVVGADEIVAQVWGGRIISDSAIAARIKLLRKAVGDSGARQTVIRTLPKVGLRFVAPVREERAAALTDTVAPSAPTAGGEPRPSLAIQPFSASGGEPAARLAEALPHDLAAGLFRLRWLRILEPLAARPSTAEARYSLSGCVACEPAFLRVTLSVADARTGELVWTERFRAPAGAAGRVREELIRATVGALDLRLPVHEAQAARLQAIQDLDPWAAFHLGLTKLYGFNRSGCDQAQALFQQALSRDPGLARAHAALSFCHFEAAFLGFSAEPDATAAQAWRSAEMGLDADPLDPFCNLMMGRAHWLRGDLAGSLPWFDRALSLNREFAQAYYARAWAQTLLDDPDEGRREVDRALELGPLDPLGYAMLGVRALTHLMRDEPEAGLAWAERAARAPGAHAYVALIAGIARTLAGDQQGGARWAASARARRPGLSSATFFRSFPFQQSEGRRRIAGALAELRV